MRLLRLTLARIGRAPKAAATEAVSRCQPNTGERRYAVEKRYRPPDSKIPVTRWALLPIQVIWGR